MALPRNIPPTLTVSVSVVVPVYNSARTLPALVERLEKVATDTGLELEIVFVNDASRDDSERVLSELLNRHAGLTVITLAANCGQHRAVFHGIVAARHDTVVTLDDDLQTPPEEMPKLLAKLADGYDIVIGRIEEKRHAWWRNVGSRTHQALVACILNKPRGLALSSYRALSARAVAAVKRHQGVSVYLPALLLKAVPAASIVNVDVEHHARAHGRSNYSLWKLFSLASRLLIDHSVIPLRILVAWGMILSALSIGYALFLCTRYLMGASSIPGWTSLMVMTSFLFGNLFIAIGILGEYTGRLVKEVSSAQDYEVYSIKRSQS